MHSSRESNENRFWFFLLVNTTPHPERTINNIVVVQLRERDTFIYNTYTVGIVWGTTIILSTVKYYNNRLPTYECVATRFRPLIRRYWNEILSETAFRVTGSGGGGVGGGVGGDPSPWSPNALSHLVDHTFPSLRFLCHAPARQQQAYTCKPYTTSNLPPLKTDRCRNCATDCCSSLVTGGCTVEKRWYNNNIMYLASGQNTH